MTGIQTENLLRTHQTLYRRKKFIKAKCPLEINHLYLYLLIQNYIKSAGHAVAQLVEALRYKPEGRGFDSFWPHYGPGVDSASNRNEYQEYFLGVKKRPYHLHVPIVLKSGSLNLLEPSGPVQACNGIALPLHNTKSFPSRNIL